MLAERQALGVFSVYCFNFLKKDYKYFCLCRYGVFGRRWTEWKGEVAKFQLRWGTAAVISMTKPGHTLLLTARCIPSLMQQLFSVYLHASTNALHHPNWHRTK